MSIGADPGRRPPLPPPWERLERTAEDVVVAVALWRRRAVEAEEEVSRLRRALEDVAADAGATEDTREEIRRLRAENAALRSRMQDARKRVGSLMHRLLALGVEP